MGLVVSAFGDPLFQRGDLLWRELPMGLGWRHTEGLIGFDESGIEGTGLGIMRGDGEWDGAFGKIEAEVGLTLSGIGTVAMEAIFGKDGEDIAIEARGGLG